jgi:site-specific recombinase XerD
MSLNAPAREIVNLIRRHRLSYDALRQATHAARKHLGLKPPTGGRHLPKLLSDVALKAYFKAVDSTDNLQHQILLRILLYTGVRVAELCAIRMVDVDLAAGKVFVESGKGDKDRYILFPDAFRLPLKAYVQSRPENEYLFESQLHRPFSVRRVQQIVVEYADRAGIEEKVHPHLFRHQCLTFLTAQGMTDAAIQLVSGHASKKSLERYQHMSLKDAREPYQEAMKKLVVD